MTFTRTAALLAVLGLAACKGLEPNPKANVTIMISPTEAEIAVGETQFFDTTVQGSDDEGVTWSVSNASVASVVDGLVTGLAAGTVDVTATSDADPEKSATATVTVTQNATELTSGTPVSGISGTSGSSKYYVITVPSGASELVVTSVGGTGDADLYVRRGSLPTTSTSDCDSESSSSDESCVIASPTAGEWYVLLYGYTSYSNVELTATVLGSTATPGFTIASASSSATVAPGASTTVSVNATRTGGFTGSIALTATGLPTGVIASFNPATLAASQTSSTLTLSAASNAAAGTSTVTIRGNSTGQAERTATVSFTVGSGGGSSQSITGYVSSDAIVVGRGQYTWFTVGTTTTSSSSISSAVTIEGLPAGVTVEWRSSMDVTPSTDAPTVFSNDYAKSARLVASAGAAPGAATITVRMTPFTAGVAPDTKTIQVSIVEPDLGSHPWQQLAVGSYPCGLRADLKTWCWGGGGTIGWGTSGNGAWVPAIAAMGREFSTISVSSIQGCGIEAGAAWCWGDPSMGKLGDGGVAQHGRFPVAVTGGLTFSTIGTGASSSCALTTGGKVYCWGSQLGGALGDGVIATNNGQYRTSPNEVNGGHTFVSLSVGKNHSCALTAAGAAYCWGLNNSGEVGDGTRTTQASPVAVAGGVTFAKIVAGNNITCGLTSAGAGYCWGLSRYVGDPSINTSVSSGTYTLTPHAIPGNHVFADISIGEDHACAVTTAGTAYCWGDNFYGEIGIGTNGSSAFTRGLTAVSGGHTFSKVEAGHDISCGVTTTSALYCWGRNYMGTLGDGSSSGDKNTPTKVLTF